jgi:PiT family inorganic phosphate transporter
MLHLLGGVFLGWSLGANDTANVFGTAVSSRMVRFLTAAILTSVFVFLGAAIEGRSGIETIGTLSKQTLATATLATVAAGAAMTLMTILGLPASASQAVVGSIIGVGLFSGGVDFSGLPKVVACWVGTPFGALFIAMALYWILGLLLNLTQPTIYVRDVVLRWALVVAGCYGAYALGANNVANVTGVYYSAGFLSATKAALVGGASIVLGVMTYSKPVMKTVGTSIVRLDAFSALVVVLAEALTVHIYTWVGVPVSTSQAVVGAVIGVGLVKQASAVRGRTVGRVFLGWLATPLVSFALAVLLHFVTHLKYVPS